MNLYIFLGWKKARQKKKKKKKMQEWASKGNISVIVFGVYMNGGIWRHEESPAMFVVTVGGDCLSPYNMTVVVLCDKTNKSSGS